MAINIVTGVPGSGKSYYAVHHLFKNYCNYDKETREVTLKPGYTIISNIDCLNIEHINLKDAMDRSKKSLEQFFHVEYQKKITEKYNKIIYFLDEAQQLFSRRYKDENVFFYFQYHRHLGHDVYIMTQNIQLIPKDISQLAEVEIRACPRTLSILGELKYNVKSGYEVIDKKVLKKKKLVFDLYKSMDQKESEKIKNPLMKYVWLALVFLVCGLFLFKHTFAKNWGVSSAASADSVKTNQFKPVLPPGKNPGPNRVIVKQKLYPVPLNFIKVGKKTLILSENGLLLPLRDCGYENIRFFGNSCIAYVDQETFDRLQQGAGGDNSSSDNDPRSRRADFRGSGSADSI